MALEDLLAIRDVRRREANIFEHPAPAADPKRIILYTMDPWQLGVVDQFLHVAFALKGHHPKSVYYDGLLPITGWENHHVPPPAPGVLDQRFSFVFDCFGIKPSGISEFLDEATATRSAAKILHDTPDAKLHQLTYRGIDVGAVCLRDLFQYTFGHFEPRGEADFALFRKHLMHALMSIDLAYAIINKERPDIVVLVNGKLVMYSYMYEVCRHQGIQVTTWEEGMYFDASIVLANNDRAIDRSVDDDSWEQFREQPFSAQQAAQVDRYFARWREQTATCHKYYDDEMRDFARIREVLNLPDDKRLISIFTNIVWDSNALGKDHAFASMMDWIYTSIDLVAEMDNAVLVIRAHPGETRCRFQTRTSVRGLLLERYRGKIPDHVRIVDGRSELSSYEIARHSFHCVVYTSTMGIEFILMGLQPLICGLPFYSRRGFTNDVATKSEYAAMLHGRAAPCSSDPELLRQFMYLTIFGLIKQPEFLVGIHDSPQVPKVRIDTFRGFPESMPVFNEIVERILNNGSFIWFDDQEALSKFSQSSAQIQFGCSTPLAIREKAHPPPGSTVLPMAPAPI